MQNNHTNEYKGIEMSSKKDAASGMQTLKDNGVSWGPRLFWIVLVLILVFFWWVLIYSGGVTPHHG